ncbi:hypothetical protein C4577_00250 [Candidatus Parcubacteria bacterium]|nr:MAG: hypothetical protein C4577_00250 [Candidatus Parcubacteria bacterium]
MEAILNTLAETLNNIILFIPQLLSGLLILIAGLIVASIVKTLIEKGAKYLNIGRWFSKAKIEERETTRTWVNILAQVAYWFIILSFLIPTFDAWGLPSITNILNRFVLYLPNVFAAVVIGFIGVIVSNIAYQTVLNASQSLSTKAQSFLASITRYSIIFFASLLALNQLGISPNLIQILLTGFVAALAIAIGLGLGLSIGLGGREAVKNALGNITSKQNITGVKGGKTKSKRVIKPVTITKPSKKRSKK